MDDLRQASAEVSGINVLSPAALAVWDAAWQLSPVNCESHKDRRRQQIAAALRAAAWQLRKAYENEECVPSPDDWLDDIATELENHQ